MYLRNEIETINYNLHVLLQFFKIKKTPKLTDPFPWNERTSLVIYATKSLDDNPNKNFPNLIYHEYHPDKSTFVSDKAPYLTAINAKEMREETKNWINNPFDKQDHQQALLTKQWILDQITKGWTHFLYETEPPKQAGNAYPWAFFAEKERAEKKNK